jgi:magnesium chelatase family protein
LKGEFCIGRVKNEIKHGVVNKYLQNFSNQLKYFGTDVNMLNAFLSGSEIEESSNLTDEAKQLLTKSAEKLKLSARSYYKTMRVARTIADMEFRDSILSCDISMALNFRRKI